MTTKTTIELTDTYNGTKTPVILHVVDGVLEITFPELQHEPDEPIKLYTFQNTICIDADPSCEPIEIGDLIHKDK